MIICAEKVTLAFRLPTQQGGKILEIGERCVEVNHYGVAMAKTSCFYHVRKLRFGGIKVIISSDYIDGSVHT